MDNFIILIITFIVIILWLKKGRTLSKNDKVIKLKFDIFTKALVFLFLLVLFVILIIAIYDSIKYSDSNSVSATILLGALVFIVAFYYVYILNKEIIFKDDTFYITTMFSKRVIKYANIKKYKYDLVEGIKIYTKKNNKFFINVQMTNFQVIADKLKNDFNDKKR